MKLNNKLTEAFAEYQSYKDSKVMGSAYEVLGQLRNILDNYYLENREKYYWESIIDAELSTFSDLSPVFDYLKDRLALIRDVVSVGTEFNEEEFVLLLTSSIEAEMISTLLAKSGADCLDVGVANKSIEEVAESNKNAFNNSLSMIRKNSLLPLVNHWISDYKH